MSKRHEFDNRLAGVIAVVGASCVALGGLLPWVRLEGPSASLAKGIVGLDVAIRNDVGGLEDGGWFLLVIAAMAGCLGIIVLWRRRRRAIVSRVCLLLLGAVIVFLGGYCIASPQHAYASTLLQDAFSLETTVTVGEPVEGSDEVSEGPEASEFLAKTIEAAPGVDAVPAIGAFLLLAGGVAMCLGALIPWRRQTTWAPYE